MNKFVHVTEAAKRDISEIAEYIAMDNKLSAQKIIETFYSTFELLSDFSEIGSIKKCINGKSTRVYTVKKNFVIVYRVRECNVEILRILTRYQDIFAVL